MCSSQCKCTEPSLFVMPAAAVDVPELPTKPRGCPSINEDTRQDLRIDIGEMRVDGDRPFATVEGVVNYDEVPVQVGERPERRIKRRDGLRKYCVAVFGGGIEIVIYHEDDLASRCGPNYMVVCAAVEVEAVVDARAVLARCADN